MKRFIVLTLIGMLTVVALFVFPSMHVSATGSHYCLAVLTNGAQAPCPEQDVLGFIKFHLSAFQTLSLAEILSLVLVSFVFGLFTFGARLNLQPQPSLVRRQRFSFNNPYLRTLISWLSLHENSPAFS